MIYGEPDHSNPDQHSPPSAKQSILVCGGTGFIGSNVVSRLVSRGHSVTALDDLSLSNDWYRTGWAYAHAKLVEGDLFDVELLQRLLQPIDVIVHCVGVDMTWPPQPLREQFSVHATGTLNLLDAAVRVGVRRLVRVGWTDPPVTCDRQATIHAFGDRLITSYRDDTDLDTAILHAPFLYGPSQPAIHYTLTPIASLIRDLSLGVTPQLICPQNQPIKLAFVDDVVAAVVELCEVDLLPAQHIRLALSEPVTSNDVIDQIAKHMTMARPDQFRQLRRRRVDSESRPVEADGRPHVLSLDRTSLSTGIAQTVRWWLDERD
jgi:nucleoside-diphosphate-sugar epimerase